MMKYRKSFLQILAVAFLVLASVAVGLELTGDSFASADQEPSILQSQAALGGAGLDIAQVSGFSVPASMKDLLPADAPNQQGVQLETMRITDVQEFMTMRVPTTWSDIETGPWLPQGNQELGVFLASAPDLEAFVSSQGPGVFFAVSRELANGRKVSNPAQEINPAILNLLSVEKGKRTTCDQEGRHNYDDKFYRGLYDVYLNCGSENDIVLVTMPAHQEFIILVHIAFETDSDLDAATEILDSFQVLNPRLVDDHHDDGHSQ